MKKVFKRIYITNHMGEKPRKPTREDKIRYMSKKRPVKLNKSNVMFEVINNHLTKVCVDNYVYLLVLQDGYSGITQMRTDDGLVKCNNNNKVKSKGN